MNNVGELAMMLTHPKALNQVLLVMCYQRRWGENRYGRLSLYSVLRPSGWLMNGCHGQGWEENKRTIDTNTLNSQKLFRTWLYETEAAPAKTFLDGPFVVKIIWGYSILRSLEGICWHMALTDYKLPQIFVRKTYCQLWNVWLITIWEMLL